MAAHTKPIRVAVVGLGWVALHRHVPAMRANPAFELAGVIDRRPGHAASVAKSLGLPFSAQASSLEGVDWLDSIDAITVATAPMAHYALVKEALLRGKEVITHGMPFYAGWGLTRDLRPLPPRRGRRRTLDELVAGTLILYPRYVDPVCRLPCGPGGPCSNRNRRLVAGWMLIT